MAAFARSLTLVAACAAVATAVPGSALPPPLTVRMQPGTTRLDDIGLYRIGYQYLEGRTVEKPIGWTGHFDEASGISCTGFGEQAGKRVFLLHPPWRGGTGTTRQEFMLSLPAGRHASLRFAIAMREGETVPGHSDGATFRVTADGRTLMEQVKRDDVWSPFDLDLTPFAGKTVKLTFETDPGPAHNPGFDYAYWGDRQIVVEGAPLPRIATAHGYDPTTARSTWQNASPAVPAGAAPALRLVRVTGDHGFLQGVALKAGPRTFGIGYGAGLDLVRADGSVIRAVALPAPASDGWTPLPAGAGWQQRIRYSLGERSINVVARIYAPRQGVVKVQVSSPDAAIANVDFGRFSPVAIRREVVVPFLGAVSYLEAERLFANVFLDHHLSRASALEGSTARYEALTDGRRNTVAETGYFALSRSLQGVLPMPGNAPSPYRAALARRVVLDVWGGAYEENADWLKQFASYGLTDFLTIVHDWQNGGYDNKLPDVLPAEAGKGGDAGMKAWVATARRLGQPIALHENFADFYPNAASYDENDVARDSANHLIPAWKNLIQSYATAPAAIMKYARRVTPRVHAAFDTNASYLDVHSAVPPWFHVDFRAGQPGAGMFSTVFNAHRDLWALFRKVHRGPVLGEGNTHWYWSGLLDGVEAQFGQGVPGSGGETAPLLVDFDLLNIHPLQFNHGMGYLERWLRTGYAPGWDARVPPMKLLDQYRMQEIAYGHAGFVASSLTRNLPFVWQEHNLVQPVTARYGAARANAIVYELDGKRVPVEELCARNAPADRVEARYSGGLTVWANSRAADWRLPDGTLLPQYGWAAVAPGLHAYTALRGGVVADYAETPETLFANARTTAVTHDHKLNATPWATGFQQDGPRRFRLRFGWTVREPLPAGQHLFVHIGTYQNDGAEGIRFQMGAGITGAPETWPVGHDTVGQPVVAALPDDLPDGRYRILVGLYQPGADRLRLSGIDDGTRRILVGTLTVTDAGKAIHFEEAPRSAPGDAASAALESAHVNTAGKMVDFGSVRTDGSFLLRRAGSQPRVLYVFPRGKQFSIELTSAALGCTPAALAHASIVAEEADGKPAGAVTARVRSVAGKPRLVFATLPNDRVARYRIRLPAAR